MQKNVSLTDTSQCQILFVLGIKKEKVFAFYTQSMHIVPNNSKKKKTFQFKWIVSMNLNQD